jgi:hypothetical protein
MYTVGLSVSNFGALNVIVVYALVKSPNRTREIYSPEVCSYSGSIQTSSSTPISYTLPFNNVIFAKNMSFSSSLDFSRFAVSTCNEFIYYPSVYDKNQNVGGYSLNFRSSII